MKICLVCGVNYDDSMFFCFEDGTILVSYQTNQPSNTETETIIRSILPKTVLMPPIMPANQSPIGENFNFSLEQSPSQGNLKLILIVSALLGLAVAAIGGEGGED